MRDLGAELPSRGQFSRHINSTFKAGLQDGSTFALHLVECGELRSNPLQESYSLIFRAPLDAPQVQSIFQIEHSELGGMDLFLVPVKKDEDGIYFEAVFNRLIGQAA